MNILMALSQLEVTGAEVYATTIADELIRRGNRVFIVSDTLTTKTQAEYTALAFNKRSLLHRIRHVRTLYNFIKQNNIHIVHAHSRASSWSCNIACKLAGIPLITTTHGRQPTHHISRKIIKAFGAHSIAVCENIKYQISTELGFAENKISVLRNPVNFTEKIIDAHNNEKPVISIVGRLTGPKGDVTYDILNILIKDNALTKYDVQVIGGKDLPARFVPLQQRGVKFLGYITDVQEKMLNSDLIIGAGRVAIEAILNKRPLIAVGEAEYLGQIGVATLTKALSSNFGDIGVNASSFPQITAQTLFSDIEKALTISEHEKEELKRTLSDEVNLETIVDKIEKKYFELFVRKKRRDTPVIMYHRVINLSSDEGVCGTYIYADTFKKHMQYLKQSGYIPITFEQLAEISWRNRFDKKYIIITFDDGYKDNYELAFPILKEFGFRATIFLMARSEYNEWDVKEHNDKRFPLMDRKMILEMQEYGIEFGAHTFNHPKLDQLTETEIENQVMQCKSVLEEKIGKSILTFAYPYGILTDYAKAMAKKAGYLFAVATDSGSVCLSEDLYQIRRIAIFPSTDLFRFKRKVSGSYNFIKVARERRKSKKREH